MVFDNMMSSSHGVGLEVERSVCFVIDVRDEICSLPLQ